MKHTCPADPTHQTLRAKFYAELCGEGKVVGNIRQAPYATQTGAAEEKKSAAGISTNCNNLLAYSWLTRAMFHCFV